MKTNQANPISTYKMEVLHSNWEIILFFLAIIWKQISDHFTIKTLKKEVNDLIKDQTGLKESINIIKNETSVIKTILEERLPPKRTRL